MNFGSHDCLLLIVMILLSGRCTLWICAVLPTFRKHKLLPSSDSEQGATNAHSIIYLSTLASSVVS